MVQLKQDKENTINTAIQRNANLAVALEQYTILLIKNADAVLQTLKQQYEREPGDEVVLKTVNANIFDISEIVSIGIIDEKGILRSSNLPITNRKINFSDRNYFIKHRDGDDGLIISEPLISKSTGSPVIVLSRRINSPDSSFAGVAIVQYAPSVFTNFYSNANLGSLDIISLVDPNGVTYARRMGGKESFSENISKSPLFEHLKKHPVYNYFAPDAIRGIPTYFSYRKLEEYPIIATVGSSANQVLADYRERAKRDYVFGGIITLLLLLFFIIVTNVLLQRRRFTKELLVKENLYRSVFENSRDAIFINNADGNIEAMNPAALRIFQLDDMDEKNIAFSKIYSKSDPLIDLTSLIYDDGGNREEVIFTRINGSEFMAENVYSYYMDYEGKKRNVILVRDITVRKQLEARLLSEQKLYQENLTKQIILAQEREREAIGHELHDNVNQILTTIKLYLEMAKNKPSLLEELLPKSIKYINNCIAEIRNLSHVLSAPTLGTQSLVDAIVDLVEMVSSSSGLNVQFKHKGYIAHLDKNRKLALFRILQEQLNNIIKHAQAKNVEVVLEQKPDFTILTIKDDGKGFDVETPGNGIGLNNMLSRAKVFGGHLEIISAPGKGTVVEVKLPGEFDGEK